MTDDPGRLRVVPRALGGSSLVRDGMIADGASRWYRARPRTPDEWRAHLDSVRSGGSGAWRESLRPALRAEGPAAERLARVADGRGVLVTTGQQPGLFGGPLYTWWKALSALALADALEQRTGIAVAPVFWAATDDADFAEARATFVAMPGGLERLELPPLAEEGARLADVPLTGVGPLLERLAQGAGSAVYPDALARAAHAYRDGVTVGDAYVALLRALLEPLGVAVLDAAHPAVRAAGTPLLDAALGAAARIEQALIERERDLGADGFRAQVPIVRGRSLVFSSADGRRERIPVAAASRAAQEPDESRGPNVLLRPLMERAILPTAAYIAGPGELAYFAQVSAVAESLGVETPLALPRWSGTVIEPHVQRLLDRHALDLDSLAAAGAAEGIVARRAIPHDVHEAVTSLRGSVQRSVDALAGALAADEAPPVPPAVLAGTARDLERRIARLDRRIVAAAKREQSEAMRDVATMRAALLPAGKPQERMLNLLPLLARHGPALFAVVRDSIGAHARQLVGAGVGPPADPPRHAPAGARERTH